MIQTEIHGRLGNQMFQYASIKGIMAKCEYKDFKINFSKGVYSRRFENDLKNFNTYGYEEVEDIKINLYQKLLLEITIVIEKIMRRVYKNEIKFNIKQNKFEKRIAPFLSKNGIYLLNQGFTEFNKTKFKNQICIGGFESAKYFNDIREEILNEFTPRYEKLDKNMDLYRIIEETESVCISIRRGDFLTSENINAHYVCTPEYFDKAVNLMTNKVKKPTFIVFSDDIEWVKENMKFQGQVFYETGDDPVWEKLRLMYSCKHFIISNSTFSWWAQYLCRNKEKIVIAPSRWKNTYQNDDIYDEKWDLIEV